MVYGSVFQCSVLACTHDNFEMNICRASINIICLFTYLQEQAYVVGRSSPQSLAEALAWAHDNFAMNICYVKRQKLRKLY